MASFITTHHGLGRFGTLAASGLAGPLQSLQKRQLGTTGGGLSSGGWSDVMETGTV